MLKRYKIAAIIGVAGTLFHSGCGMGGFGEGLLTKGFVNNWYADVIIDWLMEDLIIG